MPEAAVVDTTTATTDATTATTATATTESLGWRAGLPDDLKQNPDLAPFKTVGDFAKHALDRDAKAKELETRLADAVPKLPDDATDADRDLYYTALGRPKQASEYELDGEDKNAPEWTNTWKNEFHSLGLTKSQAKQLSGKWNAQIATMVKAHNDAIAAESAKVQSEIKTQWGGEYDAKVELAKRMWLKHGDSEFDKAFADAPPHVRLATTKLLVKLAALTGEDTSPQSGRTASSGAPNSKEAWLEMYKHPVGK